MIDILTIDPDRQYRVQITERVVIDAQTTLYPGWDIELRGDLVIAHAEQVSDAQEI